MSCSSATHCRAIRRRRRPSAARRSRATATLGRPAIAGDGVMLASVRQNNRDGLPISAEVGWNSFSNGVLSLATADVGNTIANSPKENNVNAALAWRSEEHTSELQSLMRISYAVFCLTKTKTTSNQNTNRL